MSRFEVRYGAVDADRDGDPDRTDCDDADPVVHVGASDAPYDGVDADCNGSDDFDVDGDGQQVTSHGGEDCDDRVWTHRGCVELSGTCGGAMDLDVEGLTPGGPLCLVLGRRNGLRTLTERNACAPGSEPIVEVEGLLAVRFARADPRGGYHASGTYNFPCDAVLQVLDLGTRTRTPVIDVP